MAETSDRFNYYFSSSWWNNNKVPEPPDSDGKASRLYSYVYNSIPKWNKEQTVSMNSETKSSDKEITKSSTDSKSNICSSLLAGAAAGLSVDFILYPLDTLKTRLQSEAGFLKSGGFNSIYKGIKPVILGSAPLSAIFFASYNGAKDYLSKEHSEMPALSINITSAAFAELLSASLRVPIEIVKQRQQVLEKSASGLDIARDILKSEGFKGLYRGLTNTLGRDLPFAIIQYPLWESFMASAKKIYGRDLNSFDVAWCGALAGAIAGFLTNPLDVIKTRVMLADSKQLERLGRGTTLHIVKNIYSDRGIEGFFAGAIPRVLWITFGGFFYFGVYELVRQSSHPVLKYCALPKISASDFMN